MSVGDTVVLSLPTLTVDHPFFYAIRDNETGVLLFAGVLLDPAT